MRGGECVFQLVVRVLCALQHARDHETVALGEEEREGFAARHVRHHLVLQSRNECGNELPVKTESDKNVVDALLQAELPVVVVAAGVRLTVSGEEHGVTLPTHHAHDVLVSENRHFARLVQDRRVQTLSQLSVRAVAPREHPAV